MQAEQIAKLSGKKLGKVLAISADSMDRDYERTYYPMAMMAKSSVAELADETTEVVSAGEEKISAQLEVVFALEISFYFNYLFCNLAEGIRRFLLKKLFCKIEFID